MTTPVARGVAYGQQLTNHMEKFLEDNFTPYPYDQEDSRVRNFSSNVEGTVDPTADTTQVKIRWSRTSLRDDSRTRLTLTNNSRSSKRVPKTASRPSPRKNGERQSTLPTTGELLANVVCREYPL
ncbi:hypothetical protein [Haloferax sp. DFSO60]|uniref:hypothetical protein n=1 Tax=Haloferax sp. DFSO60 TaxID=3388652 RepID=UPI00397A9955